MTSRKGIALPVETLVLLAIAMIVLLSIVAWFVGSFGQSSTTQQQAAAFQNCCMKYVNAGCPGDPETWPAEPATPAEPGLCGYNDRNNDGDRDAGELWSVQALGVRIGVEADATKIKKACNCPVQ